MSSNRTQGAGRRTLRLTVCAAMAGLLAVGAAACSSGSSSSSDSSGSPSTSLQSGKTYNITFWSWIKGSQEAVAAFNKTHPNIHVTFSEIPSGASGYTKYTNAFKAGNGPDVYTTGYDVLPAYVISGNAADITSYFSGSSASDYNKGAVAMTTLNGKSYGVPMDLGLQTLFYRKDLFKKYGLKVPTTWAEYKSDAEKLKKEAPGVYLTNYTVDDVASLTALSWQNGARWYGASGNAWKINTGDAKSEQVANYWQGMIDDGLVAKTPSNSPDVVSAVSKGTVITQLSAAWNAAYIPTTYPNLSGKWGVTAMPTFDGSAATGLYGGSAYVVNSKSKNTVADVEFAKWMTSSVAATKARAGDGSSSAYPASATALAAARKYFKSTYYPGQDLYATFDEIAKNVKPWTWGPTMLALEAASPDMGKKLYTGGTVKGLLSDIQKTALSEAKSQGLSASS